MKRKCDQLRRIEFVRNFTKHAAGSVLVKWGDTWVLCTASVEEKVPPFLKDTGRGWVTAEYSMLPSSTGGGRKDRDIKKLKMDARSTEIQRLVGRSLRAAVDMSKLGERQITVDCDVLQADGGTRCASITGGMVALEDAVAKMLADGTLAGSVLTMDRAVANFAKNTGCGIPAAVACAAKTPADGLGFYGEIGSLAPNKCADIAIFDDDVHIQKTIIDGEIVFENK